MVCCAAMSSGANATPAIAIASRDACNAIGIIRGTLRASECSMTDDES